MKTGLLLFALLLSTSTASLAQKTETIVLKKQPGQGQTVIEIKNGVISVDGKEVSYYLKAKNEIPKKIVIDAGNDVPDAMDWLGGGAMPQNKAILGVVTRADSLPGAFITQVKEGSAAARAGLKSGDRILAINETGIQNPEALVQKIGELQEGDEITVRYTRDGHTESVKATLQAAPQDRAFQPFGGGQMPNYMPFAPGQMPQLSPEDMEGLQQLFEQFQMPGQGPKLGISAEERQEGNGVLIQSITPGSPAEKAGLKAGDVLTHWNGNVITNIQTLQQQVQGAKTGKNIEVRYQRNGKVMTAQVILAAPAKRATL